MQLFKRLFPDFKVQKISVNAGFSCPNRDGTIGHGGCIYCDNTSFTPGYCLCGDSIAEQIKKGKQFFARKYPEMKYLVYFQSFTSTHTDSLDTLRSIYREAMGSPDVVGLVIGTRPDTLTPKVVDLLREINATHPVIVEIGAETSFDKTLQLINRGHTWRDVESATALCHSRGLHCGLHLIAGLPGETQEMILETVRRACHLPIDTIKLHQLQIVRGTELHRRHEAGELEVTPFELNEYLNLCADITETVAVESAGRIEIERYTSQAPPDKVIAPKWGLKNYQFTDRLRRLISTRTLNPNQP